MAKKIKSTYEKLVADPKRRKNIEKEYQALILSELLHAAMQRDSLSVRELAKEAGISPTIVQEIKTGKRTNINLSTVNRLLNAIDYEITYQPIKNRARS